MRTRDLFLLLALPVAVTACFNSDKDEDDDGGAADSDGDGLSDADEADWGTDPDDEDSDGDGVSDGAEVDAGTSPTNPYSFEYENGGYNVGNCSEPPDATSPSGENNGFANMWAEGDVADNFTLVDQYGQEVHLYSFCGQNVMIAFGAMWCGPLPGPASDVQDLQDEYGEDGFQAIEILIEDTRGNAPDQDDLLEWEADFGMTTVPVLSDGGQSVWPYYEADWGIPTVVHIGPDMTILSVDEYIYDPGQFIE